MAGKWFDELEVGQVFRHDIRRTVTPSRCPAPPGRSRTKLADASRRAAASASSEASDAAMRRLSAMVPGNSTGSCCT